MTDLMNMFRSARGKQGFRNKALENFCILRPDDFDLARFNITRRVRLLKADRGNGG